MILINGHSVRTVFTVISSVGSGMTMAVLRFGSVISLSVWVFVRPSVFMYVRPSVYLCIYVCLYQLLIAFGDTGGKAY